MMKGNGKNPCDDVMLASSDGILPNDGFSTITPIGVNSERRRVAQAKFNNMKML